EPECAAHARRRSQMDFATEKIRQLAADRKAEARAAIFPAGAGIGLLESFENNLLFFRRDANAGVRHFERDDGRSLTEQLMLRTPAAQRGRDVQTHAAA